MPQEHHHFIIHKPVGYLSQFVNNLNQSDKKLLGELGNFPEGTMAIGRLDLYSEGLLLLTTDGKVSYQIRSKTLEKEYYVQVEGEITAEAITRLQEGVEINLKNNTKYTTLACKAIRLEPAPIFEARVKKIKEKRYGSSSWLSITIREGKNKQVRKMTAAVGFPTIRLVRVRIGNIKLNNLKAGGLIELDNFDGLIDISTEHSEVYTKKQRTDLLQAYSDAQKAYRDENKPI